MNKKIILLVLSIFIVAFAIGSVIAEEQKESAEIKMLSEDTLKNGDNIDDENKTSGIHPEEISLPH